MSQSLGEGRFEPDPSYVLAVEDEERLAFWVDRSAAEYLLSGFTPEEREVWLNEVLCPYPPGQANEVAPPQLVIQEIQPSGEIERDRAVWDLYAQVRKWGGGDEHYPFPRP